MLSSRLLARVNDFLFQAKLPQLLSKAYCDLYLPAKAVSTTLVITRSEIKANNGERRRNERLAGDDKRQQITNTSVT